MDAIESVYRLTEKFPSEERYGLISQMRRAAVSVASNVAEGAARKGSQEKIQFLTIARSSLSELDAQLEISVRIGFLNENDYQKIDESLDEISRMLQGLIQSCRENT